MILSQGKIDEKLIIKNIDIYGKERRRLYDLGILPGNIIIKKFSSMFNDPICYEINNVRIAIRNKDAKYIRVEKYYE